MYPYDFFFSIQAIKVVNQKNPREDKAQKLRQNRPSQGPNARLKEQYGITYYKVKKEIAIMKKLHHPHVVRLLEVINDDQRERIFMGRLHSLHFDYSLHSPHHHFNVK
jgi:hypothetical protein